MSGSAASPSTRGPGTDDGAVPAGVPEPGQAPLPAPSGAALLRRNRDDVDIGARPAVRFGDRVWTHREYVDECTRWANLVLERRADPDAPFHVGVLLDNTPEYLFVLGGAAMAGATVVGLNHTRQGEHLARDAAHTHCALLVTEPRHADQLRPVVDSLALPAGAVLTSDRFADADDPDDAVGDDAAGALASVSDVDPGLEPSLDTRWALIFTSGTSGAPKAVICTHKRLLGTGNRMSMLLRIGPDDVGYLCMPLFHSNSLMVGWMPAMVVGASVGLRRRFSASGFLPDIRHYGVTWWNYTGKPLAFILDTPERPDDADNPLRVAYGNEGAPNVVAEFRRRFDVHVIDAFGATEGGVAVHRGGEPRAGALGQAFDSVKVVDEDGAEKPRAVFAADGGLINAEECVGEIVNTAGSGPFEGYYNNDEANARTTRFGWFWSGDLGYLDEDGYLYFAGRNADWIRVDGENFPAGPIEAAIADHPDVVLAAVYGVPDHQAGDRVMVSLVLAHESTFDGARFAEWFDGLSDIGPKWRPTYVRISAELPTTGTNKVVKRTLVHQKFRTDRCGGDPVWFRPRGADEYRPFTADDEAVLRAEFDANGRRQHWDL